MNNFHDEQMKIHTHHSVIKWHVPMSSLMLFFSYVRVLFFLYHFYLLQQIILKKVTFLIRIQFTLFIVTKSIHIHNSPCQIKQMEMWRVDLTIYIAI